MSAADAFLPPDTILVVYHSLTWMGLVECGWITHTVNERGIATMIWKGKS